MTVMVTGASGVVGHALVPLLVVLAVGASARVAMVIAAALAGLAALGALGARLGGAPPLRPALRVLVGGGLAMAATALVGRLFDVAV